MNPHQGPLTVTLKPPPLIADYPVVDAQEKASLLPLRRSSPPLTKSKPPRYSVKATRYSNPEQPEKPATA